MKHLHLVFQETRQALLRKKTIDSVQIDQKFQELTERTVETDSSFLDWLIDWNTLMGEIQDAQNLSYFQYLTSLDQPVHLQAYQHFLQEIGPLISSKDPELDTILELQGQREAILPEIYQRFINRRLNQKILRNNEVKEIQSALNQTAGEHPRRFMAARIEYGGKKNSPQEMAAIIRDADRSGREVAWHAANTARRLDIPFFQELFDKQVNLRHQLAKAAQKANYIDFRFEELGRMAYSPADCRRLHENLEKSLPDAMDQLFTSHMENMGWDEIYPWDLSKGPEAPLPVVQSATELFEQLSNFFGEAHPTWADVFHKMYESNRLDMFPRENKTMGAMTYPMKSDGLPLLLSSYHGSAPSLTQVIHELGHGIHFYLSRNQVLRALMPIPPEMGELIALSFELIALSHNHIFYQDTEARQQIVQSQLYRVFSLLALSMAMDAFQHEVYQNPAYSAEERNVCWQKHYLRFHGKKVIWHPFEEELSHYWLRHYHLFEAPLYSSEYTIAQLGALQLWQQYQLAPEATIQKLHHVMELGFSKPVKVLYGELGLDLFPDEKKIEELLSYCLDLFTKKPVEG